MWFSRKAPGKVPADVSGAAVKAASRPASPTSAATLTGLPAGQITTKRKGDLAEGLALDFLLKAGLQKVQGNFRTPGRGGGEIDLIMRSPDGTLVFVEVRQRAGTAFGGAGGSIGSSKQQRIVLAARHYLMRFNRPPPCRFDVILVHGDAGCPANRREPDDSAGPQLEWLQGAFDAD